MGTKVNKAHESTHVAGGADDIDSALALAAMADLNTDKIWKGVAGRPAEVDMPVAYSAPTRSFFRHMFKIAAYPANLGDYLVAALTAATEAYCSFAVPSDFSSLTGVYVIVVSDNTETVEWTAETNFGANGEAYNAHSDSVTADDLEVTADQLQVIDISAAFTGLAAGDYCGVKFTADAATNYCRVIGLLFTYSE